MPQPTTLPRAPCDIFNVMNYVLGSDHGLTRYYPGICLEGQKKTAGNFNEDIPMSRPNFEPIAI
jgi:hypothetical protein